ncbi:unnamed protein product [Urochloa humidicola]
MHLMPTRSCSFPFSCVRSSLEVHVQKEGQFHFTKWSTMYQVQGRSLQKHKGSGRLEAITANSLSLTFYNRYLMPI